MKEFEKAFLFGAWLCAVLLCAMCTFRGLQTNDLYCYWFTAVFGGASIWIWKLLTSND